MRWPVPFVACHLLLWGWSAAAQQNGPPPAAEPRPAPAQTPAEPPAEVLKEAPSIYMIDENGKLVPMLNWKLEDFEQLREQAEVHKQADQPPRYILQSITAAGAARADYADLTIRLKVWTRDNHWIGVPLRLEQALLSPEPVQYQGGGECFLHLDDRGKGYVAWIRGVAEGQHELTLNVKVPLSALGDETRLRLSAPPDTSSELKLAVPLAEAVGEVSDGALLSPPAQGDGQTTEFVAEWPGGEFELRWRKADTRPSGTRPILEAKGFIRAKIDKRSVIREANLTVRGHGGPLDRFRVFLPKGAELVPGNATGYSVKKVADNGAAGTELVVEVQRDKKLPEPMEVRLTTTQSREAAGTTEGLELGGFEVIDAVQQWGHVAVTTVGDWRVRCAPGRGVRQIEQLPEELQKDVQNENVVARFEYFSQPFSLSARVLEIKTHVRVEPKYRILVDAGQARLEAVLKYTVRGAKVFALDVGLSDWQVDEVGPDSVVAVDDLGAVEDAAAPSRVISIPLLQGSTGQIEVTLRAHREIPPDAASLSLLLPQPRADSLSPAELTVVPADNVELTPDAKHMAGMVPEQVPWSYRVEAAEAAFAARFKIHAQRITVGVTSEVSLGEGKGTVRQTLAYEIAYEPLDKLTLEVPRSLAASNKLEVLMEGQPLLLVQLADQASPPDTTSPMRMQVALPAARIGTCKLEIRYPIEMAELPPESSILCPVPLVMPGEGELSGNEVFVTAPQGVKVQGQPGEGPWATPEGGSGWPQRRSGPQLSADRRAREVVLSLQQEDREVTVVERAWIETCLTHNARRERAVFRFISDRKELELILPAGVDLRWVQLALGPENVEDRQRVKVQLGPEGHLVIPLPDDSNRRPQWLEARYVFSDPPPSPGRLWMDLPRLADEVWVRRMYWELVLPRNEHVLVVPAGFTAEYEWGWNGSFWGRRPVLEQSQLEEWSGAERWPEVSKSASRYLFSSPGLVGQCELRTADRWLIVLAASSAVLVAGLLLIYIPATRHPAALLAVAVGLLGAAVLYPGPALLASQAGSLGLALALVAALLYRTLGPGRGGAVRRETSSSVLDRSSTQAQYRPPMAGNQGSTASVPAEIPVPTSDSSP